MKKLGGKREGSGRKKILQDPEKFMGYKYEKEEVLIMKKNIENYMQKKNIKTTTDFLKKLFLEEII